MDNKITIYTDGSCLGNPGPGGWGAVVFFNGQEIELVGGEKDTTNNRMEMMAIIQGLKWVRTESGISESELPNYEIGIFSDSNLIIQTMNKGWKKKANVDLWAMIEKYSAWINVKWTWVKAHAENEHNNRVDALAFGEAQKFKRK